MTPEQKLQFMTAAMNEGQRALPACRPNPPVGCVAVREGQIIASGFTLPPGQHHAEASVLAQLAGDVSGVSLFVTLEPCSFVGRTPSCAHTIVEQGIEHVYVGLIDPHSRNQGRGIAVLEEAGVKVETGILKAKLNTVLGPYLITNE
ncbi:bifunctional diaminohydroxyphosphoribosylaminopyrimidine deaminase/5-amino-6-(5-phosphoribosylamino)uracil reductase RibD [Motilimonas pumila]|uniref:Riboflavin-specific deaminase n=1 Tax=Motilimonas pumila TaxID=2303987 RepID=A0A418YHM2_9GAMM|nr:bifunctional diaminohydroxyphosphoribosylaminopyrimidine deaminase/5-amino-6-(5-phosphoribosylamino)uracil reductase RibD [Motilimonas pumila]RJG49554.1 riboflavin-specific deaminase [Motilimonas pumila]